MRVFGAVARFASLSPLTPRGPTGARSSSPLETTDQALLALLRPAGPVGGWISSTKWTRRDFEAGGHEPRWLDSTPVVPLSAGQTLSFYESLGLLGAGFDPG